MKPQGPLSTLFKILAMMPNNHPEFIELNLPANPKFFNVVGACITEMLARVSGIDEREVNTYSIQLAVQEVCTNIVDHAYVGSSGRISITLTVEEMPPQMIIDMHDNAERGFDPTTVGLPSIEHLSERGRGMLLIRQLVDEVLYQPVSEYHQFRSRAGGDWELETKPPEAVSGGNSWHLVKKL